MSDFNVCGLECGGLDGKSASVDDIRGMRERGMGTGSRIGEWMNGCVSLVFYRLVSLLWAGLGGGYVEGWSFKKKIQTASCYFFRAICVGTALCWHA